MQEWNPRNDAWAFDYEYERLWETRESLIRQQKYYDRIAACICAGLAVMIGFTWWYWL